MKIAPFALGLLLASAAAFAQQAAPPAPPTTGPAPVIAPSLPTPTAITPTEKMDLFNGKDFTGWVAGPPTLTAQPSGIWSIKDGILTCSGRPNGYLRTEKSFTQYKLIVEWRFTRAGNTGVLVHMNPPPAPPVPPATAPAINAVWPMCIECQGAHDHQGDFWIWSGAKVNEPFTTRNGITMTIPSAEKPVGEWNTYQVLCKDDTVTIVVNGTTMSKVTGANVKQGQVALQCEGAAFEVRKFTIEPLTP